MANDTLITIIGNLTEDPQLTQVNSNSAVCNFSVASTPSTFDRDSGEYKDKETIFMRSAVWREQAENLVDSLSKGDRVIVQGYLRANTYEVNGEKRVSFQMEVVEMGPSLRYAKAKVTKNPKGGNAGGGNTNRRSAPAPKQDTDGWGDETAGSDAPPF